MKSNHEAILFVPIMALLSAVLAALSLLSCCAQAATLRHYSPRQSSKDLCTDGATIPNLWLVKDLKVAYAQNDGDPPSNASFSLTNTWTNVTETLRCNLRANYQCQFSGTPQNSNIVIWLQLNLAAYFTMEETQKCDGKTASIVGMAEMSLVCTDSSLEEGMTCAGGGEPEYASGTVSLAAPSGSENSGS